MSDLTVARNDKTSLYEVHVTGCFHLQAPHMEPMYSSTDFAHPAELVADFENGNEGCYAKLGPCARKLKL